MATYAVGDIHGCFAEFERLLKKIDFDGETDHIWHVGDLVNGGPDSLGALRWFYNNEASSTTVLGNHDLHLVAVAYGAHKQRSKDTFGDVLGADDGAELVDWLRRRPLVVQRNNRVLVHAGLLPQWSLHEASEMAREVEEILGSSKPEQVLEVMYGNQPRHFDDATTPEERWRAAINVFTRMRVLDADGGLNFRYKSTYGDIPADKYAWFDADEPAWVEHQVICGHWSALGLHRSQRVIALDTGCRWGNKLTAIRLDDDQIFSVDASSDAAF